MQAINQLARQGKRTFIRSKLHRLVEPFNFALLRLAFLSKLSKWCSEHPQLGYNDLGDADYRFEKKYALYDFLLEAEGLDGAVDYLEFGVAGASTFRWWIAHNRHPASRFVGFDTFTGLPEQWGVYKEGAFSTGGTPPAVEDARCRFEVGLFQDTLGDFLATYTPERRKVVHLDADLYSSTLFVLTRLAPVLKAGDILIFDEFAVPTHEFRAFTDFVSAYRVAYEVLGAANFYTHVAVKLA